jgi:alcohol dehydrogenase
MMSRTMRAAVIREHGGLERIVIEDDYPRPVVKPGWVVLRVRACSLNYHDIFTRRSMPGIKVPLPIVVGSDIAGEIAEVGEGVTGWREGDRVLVDPLPCEATGGRMVGEMYDGGRAEYCLAHASQLVPLPAEVSFEVAASIPLAYATAHRMMVTQGGVAAGETVLILGASGGVGTGCVMLAKLAGATVVACAGSDDKAARLSALGADQVVNYRRDNVMQAVHERFGKPRITGTGGVDMVVNYTGGGSWQESIRCLKVGGRLLTCGATAGYDEKIDVRYVWTFELKLMGSNGWRRDDITALVELARTGRLVPVIDRVLPLSEVREAERLLEDREVFGKVVVTP